MKPRLREHYHIRYEPPDQNGEEGLVFTSEGKRLAVRGSAFREFLDLVVPLLDGRHTVREIEDRVAGTLEPGSLTESLELLVANGIVEDAEVVGLSSDAGLRIGPHLAYLSEVDLEPAPVLDRLASARVSVVGTGAVGCVAATALAAAGVGHVRCIDGSTVAPADPYLAQLFGVSDVGRSRAEVTRDRIQAIGQGTRVEIVLGDPGSDGAMAGAVEGSDFVLGCLDPGLVADTHQLNRACLDQGITWCAASVSAFEGIVGPTVIPFETACFTCYEQRAIACRDDPVDALADLEERKQSPADESSRRENLAFGAGIIGQFLALQAYQSLTGTRPATAGRIVTVDFRTSSTTSRLVLRKPWCPACFPRTDG